MEYQIFSVIRNKYKIPFLLRVIVGGLLLLLSIPPIFLPIFPGSLFVGVYMFIVSILLFISARRIRHLIKIRKGIVYLFSNFYRDRVIKNKMKNFSNHIKDILKQNK